MHETKENNFLDVILFVFLAISTSFIMNWAGSVKGVASAILLAPFAVGVLAFAFQALIIKSPLIALYTKSYPYRRLKPYGVVTTFLLFEFLLAWGLHTKQIDLNNGDIFLITIIFIGVIVYYHLFVRMKISLRFFFLAILIPFLALAAAVGLSSRLNLIQFISPTKSIYKTVILNTFYWIISGVFFQLVCEELAFRGYLMQRLVKKNEFFAVLVSSLVYAIWRLPFSLFIGAGLREIIITFSGSFITGIIFALLFIKGRNLLVPVLCHSIISGLQISLFTNTVNPGISSYIDFIMPVSQIGLMSLWIGSLAIGLILLTLIPRKNLRVL